MKALKDIDVAFLPMNLPYTMTPEMVADRQRRSNREFCTRTTPRNEPLEAYRPDEGRGRGGGTATQYEVGRIERMAPLIARSGIADNISLNSAGLVRIRLDCVI